MKALVLHSLGRPPQFEESYPAPVSRRGWETVEVHYAAINRRDAWIVKGQYADIRVPVILGSDAAGWHKGKKVLVNPGLNWGDNPRFQGRAFSVLGMPHDGTFAEQVLVPEGNIYPVPPHLTLREAAALPLAGVTAWRALFYRGQLQEGQRVLITGIGGGVAHLAMKFALAAGVCVGVTSSQPKQLSEALRLGVECAVNYREDGWSKTLKKQMQSFDLIIDSAAGETYHKLVQLLDYGGSLVSYGGTNGRISSLSPQVIFWKQLQLMGTTMGSPMDFRAMLQFVQNHEIVPDIGAFYPLEQGAEALAEAALGGHRKIVLEIHRS